MTPADSVSLNLIAELEAGERIIFSSAQSFYNLAWAIRNNSWGCCSRSLGFGDFLSWRHGRIRIIAENLLSKQTRSDVVRINVKTEIEWRKMKKNCLKNSSRLKDCFRRSNEELSLNQYHGTSIEIWLTGELRCYAKLRKRSRNPAKSMRWQKKRKSFVGSLRHNLDDNFPLAELLL